MNAAVQVQLAIEKLQAAGALNTLPETLRHTARLRMQYSRPAAGQAGAEV